MNRQLKRANEKSDKRREREQAKRKEQRQAKRVRVVEAREAAKQERRSAPQGEPAAPGGPGRWRRILADAYLLFTISVIASQPFFPQPTNVASLATHALFYVILGYFLCRWLLRRGVAQAFPTTLAAGGLLAIGVEAAKLLVPQSTPNLLFIYLALPGLLLGAWLGRAVFRRGN